MKITAFAIAALPWGGVCAAAAAATTDTPYQPFYDETWGGPVQIAQHFQPSLNSSGFNLVEATLVMPRLRVPRCPRKEADQYTASYWIGLDGFLPSTDAGVRGLWQAGVIMSLWENGTAQYTGFYEWVPADPILLTPSELSVVEGDHLRVSINTTMAGYHGSVTLTNLNTSQTFVHSQDATKLWRGPTFPAPGSSAEWIIEAGTDLEGNQYVFPDWGQASFRDARACYVSGKCVVPGDVDTGSNNTRMTVVRWNDTQVVNTQSSVAGDRVSITYVEEPFVN
ncbi:aspergillopepsin-2 [Diplocarpon rosae]|nr:aspergillopepsin-2 [Diplocarpon rosae]